MSRGAPAYPWRSAEQLLAPPSRFERVLYAVAWSLIVGLCKAWFRVEVEGREHLPADGPFVLAPSHRSNLDFALVVACGSPRRRFRYLSKDSLWRPGFGRLWYALGAIPVHRGTPDREALRTSIGVLEAGEPLVVFPEGARQSGPELRPLFDGPAFVAARTGVPVVPVGIGGSEMAMPKGQRLIRPQKVVVVVGEALEPPRAPSGDPRDRVPRSALHAHTTVLAQRLQPLFDRAQQLAGTPNPPAG